MRIFGFSRKWPKLQQDVYSSFRYPRKDSDKGRDWHLDEIVKVVYHPRQEGEYLGIAQFIGKQPKRVYQITKAEAIADGFDSYAEMMEFLKAGEPNIIINKLTLKWIERTK